MKIFFYNKGPEKLGTQRIYVQNLAKWLKPLAKKIKIEKIIRGFSSLYNVKILIT